MNCGSLYHLYTHANGFENLFRSDENYRYFLRRYAHFIPSVADTLAYCLMPNHIHFLIRIRKEAEIESAFQSSEVFGNLRGLTVEKRISKQFSNLFNSYTKAFNKMYSRRGSLFIPNFKRKEITNENYFTSVIRYIHTNPVHHGFVESLESWPWSSYGEILEQQSRLVNYADVIQWFGNRKEFVEFHQSTIDMQYNAELIIE